jgi:Zn-dependent protease with chaperone function
MTTVISPRAPRAPVRSRSRMGTSLFRLTLALAAAATALATGALIMAGRSLQVRPDAPVHHLQALGRTITYPSANPSALLVLALAAAGLVVLVRALRSVARQGAAQRALARSLRAGHVRDLGEVAVIRGKDPSAICAGLRRPRIYVTTAALDVLSPPELEAVVAHEAHHRARRDPLRLAIAQVLGDALPPVRRLAREHALATEIDADAAAVQVSGGDSAPLARAMLRMAAAPDGAVGIEAGRVDSLLGRPPGRLLPICCAAGVLAALAVLGLFAVLAARTATSGATLALPVLSSKPCIVALALLPGSLAAVAAVFLRRRS